jgi:hypothetical protein
MEKPIRIFVFGGAFCDKERLGSAKTRTSNRTIWRKLSFFINVSFLVDKFKQVVEKTSIAVILSPFASLRVNSTKNLWSLRYP